MPIKRILQKIFCQSHTFSSAFSLIEMLVYISILAVIFILVVSTTLSFTSSYRMLAALRAADHAGIDALEPMTRAIRAAGSVLTTQSVLGSNPGTLALYEAHNGDSTTTQFNLQNGVVEMAVTVNGVADAALSGPLTSTSATVTSLVFNVLSTSTASAVKIDMTAVGISGAVSESKNFHDTIVLRGSTS